MLINDESYVTAEQCTNTSKDELRSVWRTEILAFDALIFGSVTLPSLGLSGNFGKVNTEREYIIWIVNRRHK